MTNIRILRISTEKDMEKCFHIRTLVFTQEQNVSGHEEIDGLDPQADHYLLLANDAATATARVRYPDGVAKIERVAVLKTHRGLNIGRQLMEFIMADIQKNPAVKMMKLGAQIQVVDFYEKLGFKSHGDEFLDAGIRHIWMKRKI